jgi:hypothetical protein
MILPVTPSVSANKYSMNRWSIAEESWRTFLPHRNENSHNGEEAKTLYL